MVVINEEAFYVPLLESLEQLLNNSSVFDEVRWILIYRIIHLKKFMYCI
jgi:hypothetical protein